MNDRSFTIGSGAASGTHFRGKEMNGRSFIMNGRPFNGGSNHGHYDSAIA